MRDDRERLLDIIEAIERIERYASRGREAFENEELVQTWIVYHIQRLAKGSFRNPLGRNYWDAQCYGP